MKALIEVVKDRTTPKLDGPLSFPEATLTSGAKGMHIERTEPFIDAPDAARFLKLHPKTLLRLARRGSIPAHPLTGRRRHIWRFLLSELDAWARSRLDSGSDRCQNSRS